MKRRRVLLSWLLDGRRTAVEVAGVGAIAGAGYTINEGWALLIVGAYLVLAANTGARKGGRR